MKKYAIWIVVLSLSLITAACNYGAAPNNNGTNGYWDRNAINNNTLNNNGFNNYAPFRYDGNSTTTGYNTDTVGFSRSSNAEIRNNGTGNYGNFFVNRDILAQLVSNVSVIIPGVDSCVTAVTDQYIFIGIKNNNQVDKNTIHWVKKAASSVSPGYFKVYATSDPKLANRIERLNNMTIAEISGPNNEVDQLIREMGGNTRGGGKQQAPNRTGNTSISDEL